MHKLFFGNEKSMFWASQEPLTTIFLFADCLAGHARWSLVIVDMIAWLELACFATDLA